MMKKRAKQWRGDGKHDERNGSRDCDFSHLMFDEYFVVVGIGLSADDD